MDYYADIRSYLQELPTDVPEDFIAFRSRSSLMCVPVPPWSTPKNLSQTTGVLAWRPDQEDGLGLFIPEDPAIDSHATFQLIPRDEPIDSWRRLFLIKADTFKDADFQFALTERSTTLKNNARRIRFVDQADRICAIDLYHDPFGRPMTCMSAVCLMRVEDTLFGLSHVQHVDRFDIKDEANWPIGRAEMERRVDYVSRMHIKPFIT